MEKVCCRRGFWVTAVPPAACKNLTRLQEALCGTCSGLGSWCARWPGSQRRPTPRRRLTRGTAPAASEPAGRSVTPSLLSATGWLRHHQLLPRHGASPSAATTWCSTSIARPASVDSNSTFADNGDPAGAGDLRVQRLQHPAQPRARDFPRRLRRRLRRLDRAERLCRTFQPLDADQLRIHRQHKPERLRAAARSPSVSTAATWALAPPTTFSFVGTLISTTAYRSNETIGTSVTTPGTDWRYAQFRIHGDPDVRDGRHLCRSRAVGDHRRRAARRAAGLLRPTPRPEGAWHLRRRPLFSRPRYSGGRLERGLAR